MKIGKIISLSRFFFLLNEQEKHLRAIFPFGSRYDLDSYIPSDSIGMGPTVNEGVGITVQTVIATLYSSLSVLPFLSLK